MPLPMHRKQGTAVEEGKQLKRLKKSVQEPEAPKVKDVNQLDRALFGDDIEPESIKRAEHIQDRRERKDESKVFPIVN